MNMRRYSMNTFDKDKANFLIEKYKKNNDECFIDLDVFLSTIKSKLKKDSSLAKNEDLFEFIYSIINYTKIDAINYKKIVCSCVAIAEIIKQKYSESDFYNECLRKCLNHNIDISGFIFDLLEMALKDSEYVEPINIIIECIMEANENDGFELLYKCCKCIDSNKNNNLGGKSNYQIGAHFLNELQKTGYEMPLKFRPLKIKFISKFEEKCNKEKNYE